MSILLTFKSDNSQNVWRQRDSKPRNFFWSIFWKISSKEYEFDKNPSRHYEWGILNCGHFSYTPSSNEWMFIRKEAPLRIFAFMNFTGLLIHYSVKSPVM